jgi:CheY-like chemotaxis protein
VLVDDEPPVTDVVGAELKSRGYRVFTASSPGSGAKLIRTRRNQGESVLAAVDLKMPTSSGESFYGGFELIRRLQREPFPVPVLLMAESLSDAARDQAKALGVRRIVYKPTLTKPDAELYRTDLREFADTVEKQLENLVVDLRASGGPVAPAPIVVGDDGDEPDRTEFIAAMTKKLVEPGGSNDVSLLVMQVAARFVERGVLFVVKSETARGLAGFGYGANEKNCADVTRNLSLSIDRAESLSEVVRTGMTVRLRAGLEELGTGLLNAIGRGNASEGVLMPMLYNRATLLLLYGDNGVGGRPLGDLSGLELFMAQAGMALENKLLQRKLSPGEYAAVEGVQ